MGRLINSSVTRIRTLRVWVLMIVGMIGCTDGSPRIVQLMEAQRLSGELLIEFVKASEASDRAVMADTNEAAVRYAGESAQLSLAVERSVRTLRSLLKSLDFSPETSLLKEFEARYARYVTLDHTILALAVESSNIKAQRISFGPAMERAQGLERALFSLAPAPQNDDGWRTQALAMTAMNRVREIQFLLAPHIAAAEDAKMAALEAQMSKAEADARRALAALTDSAVAGDKSALNAAQSELESFIELKTQIVDLSRRNTNVRSLALSFGQKRLLSAACEDSLRALQKALLGRRDSPATR